MFSKKKSIIPVQEYKLAALPSPEEVETFVETATKFHGTKHKYMWEDWQKNCVYTLTVFLNKAEFELEWWLHQVSTQGNKMLWFYRTTDVGTIYPQICESIGAKNPFVEEEDEEEEEAKPSSLGERFGKRTTETEKLEEIAQEATAEAANRLLSGDLRSNPITNLLSTAKQDDVTGHLTVEGEQGTVVIQFGLGRPVHAYSPNGVGTGAILELFTWDCGAVSFNEGVQPEAATVQESCDELIKLGGDYLTDKAYLDQLGISASSALIPNIEYQDDNILEHRLGEGRDHGKEVQKKFYKQVDGSQTIEYIAIQLSLAEARWSAIVSNLLKLGLVLTPQGQNLGSGSMSNPAFGGSRKPLVPPPMGGGGFNMGASDAPDITQNASRSTQSATGPILAARPADRSQQSATGPVPPMGTLQPKMPPRPPERGGATAEPGPAPKQAAFGSLVSKRRSQTKEEQKTRYVLVGVPDQAITFSERESEAMFSRLVKDDTGILSSDAFQFFLHREFMRAFRFGTEFTMVLFCIKLASAEETDKVPASALAQLTKSVNSIKREVDLFGHFGIRGFALLLPCVNSQQSCALVDRIASELDNVSPELAKLGPSLHFGLASVPHDAKELRRLVSACNQAMFAAVKKKQSRQLFSELEAKILD